MNYFAILSIGAVVVPVNPLSTEPELLHIFRDGQVRAIGKILKRTLREEDIGVPRGKSFDA